MKYCTTLLIFAIIIAPISMVSAEESKTISVNLDSGMISTAPLVISEQIMVKSIGQISSLNATNGEINWIVKHPTPHLFETAPLIYYSSNESELLITGWTDGMICAYDILNGTEKWNHSTSLKGYGITGKMIIYDEKLVVPFDHGIVVLNPDDGNQYWNATLEDERFYRSSPLKFNNSLLLGSENGQVWSFKEGESPSLYFRPPESILSPKIRGDIFEIENRLLIPVQGIENSSVVELDGNTTVLHKMGGSLGLMVMNENVLLATSSNSSKLFDCSSWCMEIQTLTDEPVVGEAIFDGEQIILPVNSLEGKWLRFNKNCSNGDCEWVAISTLYHSHPQFLTAAPGFYGDAIVIANDAGWVDIVKNSPLRTYEVEKVEQKTPENSEYIALFFLVPGSLLILAGIGKEDFRKFSPAIGASLILLGAGYYIPTLQSAVSSIESESEDPLRSIMPEQWIDTQVVVFELSDGLTASHQDNHTFIDFSGQEIRKTSSDDGVGRLFVGGFSGHNDVRSLTIAAAEVGGLIYVEHVEELGYRVDRIGEIIDGKNGHWLIYYEDGNRGPSAIDANSIVDDAVIIWKIETF